MVNMSTGQLVSLVLGFILCLSGLALMAVSIGTDNWYKQKASKLQNTTDSRYAVNSFHYGLWRKCYNTVPPGIRKETLIGPDRNCVYLELVKLGEAGLSFDAQRYMHLKRSHVGLICASCALQFFTLIVLIFGLWPVGSCLCKTLKKTYALLGAGILTLLAAVAGMAGGICFIALRDLDVSARDIYPYYVTHGYDWSFILAWVSAGLCLFQSFIFLFLFRFADNFTYYYYTKPYSAVL